MCLSATSARIDFQYRVHGVLVLAQHVFQLEVLDALDSLGIIGVDLLLRHEFLLIIVESELQLVGILLALLVAVEPFLYALHLLHLRLSPFGVIPKVRSLRAQLLLLEFYFLLVNIEIVVKLLGTLQHVFQLI